MRAPCGRPAATLALEFSKLWKILPYVNPTAVDGIYLRELIERELQADAWETDATCQAMGTDVPARGNLFTREAGVFCGERVIAAFSDVLQGRAQLETHVSDGARVELNQRLVTLTGKSRTLLGIERTLLNLLSHASGIASLTRKFVEEAQGKSVILATRKTLPGLRPLQLYAVSAGGGRVHRRSLADGILIKDNHLNFTDASNLFARARNSRSPLLGIEVECDSLEKLKSMNEHLPDVVMLDNLSDVEMKEAVRWIDGRCRVEVSGGVNLERVRRLCELGVDYISVGRLTHSVPALDLSLEIVRG